MSTTTSGVGLIAGGAGAGGGVDIHPGTGIAEEKR